MIPELEQLTRTERDLVVKAPLIVGILMAGADGNMDTRERRKLESVIFQKAEKFGNPLNALYHEIRNNLTLGLVDLIHSHPKDPEERNRSIIRELGLLNDILPKLEPTFAQAYYESLREMAEKVAKASGGFLSVKPISRDEKKYVLLSMVQNPGLE